jgi:PAS domain S-box-containing protein
MKRSTVSERAVVLAPRGRDAAVATAMLIEAGIEAVACVGLPELIQRLDEGVAFVVVTEEAIATANLAPLSDWLADQEEWSDLPFVLLTTRGGGLERNPAAARHLDVLGNVTFLERPFHPTTLVSLARSALRGRRRQYEARARLLALRSSEQRFRTLFDTMDEGFCVIRFIDGEDGPLDDYVHVEVNAAFERHSGIVDAEGKRIREMVPDQADEWVATYRQVLLTGETLRFERQLTSTGRFLELSAFRVEGSGHPEVAVIFQDTTARKRAEIELREFNETLERRIADAVAEREAAAAQLVEAQKLETLGQLTGGVAHDVNNLLTPITGALDLLQRKYADDDPRAARWIDGALQSAERARLLVSRLLGFARRQALETRAVDVGELLEGMRDLVASSIGAGIELHIQPAATLPAAVADPNQLELALLNLCVNARDAMPDGGSISIAADRVVVGPDERAGLAAGIYVRLSVVDTGVGMDKATLARAIEPFYSTKDVGKGTGLGLSMVHGLAAQLGGAFVLSSVVGKGTRADLYLPVSADDAPTAARAVREVKVSRPLNILLVDDEQLVRDGTAEMLRDMGHSVDAVDGANRAIARLDAGGQFDAVVTDYMMPGMTGAQLAAVIEQRVPGLPVLVITGYAGGDLQIGLPHLSKPFRRSDLAAALERLIGGATNVVAFRQR